jgi:hypothetical protein
MMREAGGFSMAKERKWESEGSISTDVGSVSLAPLFAESAEQNGEGREEVLVLPSKLTLNPSVTKS